MTRQIYLWSAADALIAALAVVHVVPATEQTTELVSKDSLGTQGNDWSHVTLVDRAISADGRIVAFYSRATNLEAGSTSAGVFVHDRDTGVTERISTGVSSTAISPSISADGRFVAFGFGSVYVHDRDTGETTRVSVASDGAPGNS